jgi:subtilisin family serine protease
LEKNNITVAVLDSGIDIHHPDLADILWQNPLEASGIAGKDDDENGFVDDSIGWDFVSSQPNISDSQGHGTHLAGIISQQPSSSRLPVQIMALKISEDHQQVRLSSVLSALEYARDNGADIINMSFGFSEDSEKLHDLIREMHSDGIFFLAAAGNHSGIRPYYPAAYDEVISIGSSDISGTPKNRSNSGDWVDAFFPADFVSTIPGGTYGILGGTSQASAFASSLAAEYLLDHPEVSFDEMHKHLLLLSRQYYQKFTRAFVPDFQSKYLTLSGAGYIIAQALDDSATTSEILRNLYLSAFPLRMTSWQTKMILSSPFPRRFLTSTKAQQIGITISDSGNSFHASAGAFPRQEFVTAEELRILLDDSFFSWRNQ